MALFKFLFGRMNKEEYKADDSTAELSATKSESDPAYTLRIAAYDSMSVLPRTVDLSSDDFTSFVDEATARIYGFCKERGGSMPFVVLREAVENLIHANFKDAVVTIMPDGNVVRISDHGPGIQRKGQATMPGFTSTTAAERDMIKGVGSGFPIMIESLESLGGFVTIEDNLGSGLVVTLCSTSTPTGSGYSHGHPGGAHSVADTEVATRPDPSRPSSKIAGPPQAPGQIASPHFVQHGQGGNYQHLPRPTLQQGSQEIWTSRQTRVPSATHTQGKSLSGAPGGHMFQPDPGKAQQDGSPGTQRESDPDDMETISDEDRDSLSAEKQDSDVNQSKKGRDEEPPSESQPSDMSNEALGALLSSRQKKVFLLIAEMGEIGPSIVTRELDISLSTAYRDLVTLEELGLVVSLEGGKRQLTRRGIDFLSYVFR